MTIKEHVQYWIDTAENDLDAAERLYASGKYDWCLFIGHLVLEKALKALFVIRNNNKVPPKIHDLTRLAEKSSIELTPHQKKFLDRVTDFNIEGRYPAYKQEFYKLCTKEFADEYYPQILEMYRWLKSLIV